MEASSTYLIADVTTIWWQANVMENRNKFRPK